MPSINNKPQIIKTYFFHPKEWKLGVLLLLLIGYARLFHFSSSSDSMTLIEKVDTRMGRLEDARSEMQVQRIMQDSYCRADADILCGNADLVGGCIDVYGTVLGTALGRLWGVSDGYRTTQSCSLTEQMPVDANNLPLVFSNEHDDSSLNFQERQLVRLILYSYMLMWTKAKLYFSNSQDEERMINYYSLYILDLFGSPRAFISGITDEKWSREQVVSFMRVAVDMAQQENMKSHIADQDFYDHHIPLIVKVMKFINYNVQLGNYKGLVTIRYGAPYQKYECQLFPLESTSHCINFHYQDGLLISNQCNHAVNVARNKILELEHESGGDFFFVTHMYAFGINFTCCLVLLRLFNSKKRLEKKMDEGKRRLENELNDPFLRQSLERKAEQLPPDQREHFIARLEAKVARWDSKAAALYRLRHHVRKFRYFVLFCIVFTTIMHRFLYADQVYMETLFLSVLMLVLSYAIPIGNSDEDGLPSEILMGTMDPSTTQALLSSEEESSPDA
jgi:hypothetical protein